MFSYLQPGPEHYNVVLLHPSCGSMFFSLITKSWFTWMQSKGYGWEEPCLMMVGDSICYVFTFSIILLWWAHALCVCVCVFTYQWKLCHQLWWIQTCILFCFTKHTFSFANKTTILGKVHSYFNHKNLINSIKFIKSTGMYKRGSAVFTIHWNVSISWCLILNFLSFSCKQWRLSHWLAFFLFFLLIYLMLFSFLLRKLVHDRIVRLNVSMN